MEKARVHQIYGYIFNCYKNFYLDKTDNFVKSEEYYLKESEEKKKSYILIPKCSDNEQIELVKGFIRNRFSDEKVNQILKDYAAWEDIFTRFHIFLEENCLCDDYFSFQDMVAIEKAKSWLEDNNIEYTSDSYILDSVKNYINNDADESVREKFFIELEKDKEKDYLEAFKRLCLDDGTTILFDFYESDKNYEKKFEKYLYSLNTIKSLERSYNMITEKEKEEYKNASIEGRKEFLYYVFKKNKF